MRRLIIRPGAIGDFIVALPAMEALRAEDTEVWASGANVALARFADRARSITVAGLDRLGLVEADDVVERLRSFDSIVSWYGTNRPDFRTHVAALGLPFTFLSALPGDTSAHAIDFFLEQVGAPPGGVPQIDVPRVASADFIVLHPFSGSSKKNWPLDRFEQAATRWKSVRWIRGPEDELPAAHCIPGLYDLACWLKAAGVFVGNDSGITHLAAAIGIPVVALFGPSDPRVWAPRGLSVEVIARPSLLEIDVDQVAEAIARLAHPPPAASLASDPDVPTGESHTYARPQSNL